MKKIMVLALLLGVQSFGLAQAGAADEVKERLKQGHKMSFRFHDNSIQTAAYLIQHETGIRVIIDKNVDTKANFPIHLRDQNFLTYLDITTQRLGLKYEILNANTIRVYQ